MLDKVIAVVTPPESEEARAEARRKSRSLAGDDDWLSQVLAHHEQIESAFARVKRAGDARSQREAEKQLARLLTGHSVAEEAVLYPALVKADEKGHSTMAYAGADKPDLSGAIRGAQPFAREDIDVNSRGEFR